MGFQDDVIYCSLLVVSIIVGHYIKNENDSRKKQIISAIVGFLMVVFVCRIDLLHSLFVASVNGLIVCHIKPRYCHVISFIWCFGYITFFRTTHYFGLPKVLPHSNAVQLLLTLKMVGLAFEVHDTAKLKHEAECSGAEEKKKLQYKYQRVVPSYLDVLLYAYCYIGLLTGPYFKYRTYHDMINQKNTRYIDIYQPLVDRLKKVPVYITLYLLTSYTFPLDYVKEDAFLNRPFLYRFLYMVITFFWFRMRFYVAWVLSECLCISATLGAYPVDSRPKCGVGPIDFIKLNEIESVAPNAVVYNYETIHNIDEYGCEFAPTVRGGMRCWNMSVQYWLAHHVYKRVHFKASGARVAVTMLVSAYWHGIHPGYYLSFLTIPLTTMAEDLMISTFRKNATPEKQLVFDRLCWFFKMRAFDYMCMGFVLLTYHDTMLYWGSIYYIVHVFVFMFIAIGLYFSSNKKKTSYSDSNSNLTDKKLTANKLSEKKID